MNATNRQLWRLNELGLLALNLTDPDDPDLEHPIPARQPIGREQAKQALSQALDTPNADAQGFINQDLPADSTS